jgi:hypothetical protein
MRSLAPQLFVAATVCIGSGAVAAVVQQSDVGQSVSPAPAPWPGNPELSTPFPAPAATPPPLPAASITEPFAIGEALYDPGRMPQAVMSLLAQMRISVASAPTPAGTALTLDESEARTLIGLAEEDLRSASDIDSLPFGFADLHRAVSGLRPELTIDALAATYTRVYESQPDALVAKVMMGQPLEPDTRLTRTQIWLLLMDGFAGPGGANAPYGAADRELPDLPSPNPTWSAAEWREVLARLPLVATSSVLAVESAADGTTLRLASQLPPLLSRFSGKPLVAARAGSLAGQEVTWEVDDEEALRELVTWRTPVGQPTPVAANGVAVFAVASSAAGPGEVVQEWSSVSASLPGCPLVSSAYTIPPPLCAFVIGSRRVTVPIPIPWRTTDKLWVAIRYDYALRLRTPIGEVRREGQDAAYGWLVRRPNGSYVGTMVGIMGAAQEVRGSTTCGSTSMSARQELHVEGRMLPKGVIPGTGAAQGGNARTRDLESYHWGTPGKQPLEFVLGASWDQQPPSDGYLVLEFFPKTAPATFAGRTIEPDPVACLPLIKATEEQNKKGAAYFIPFNDAQWTIPSAGYAIGLRRAREYYFVDDNNATSVLGDFSVENAAGESGRARWTVNVRRPSLAP